MTTPGTQQVFRLRDMLVSEVSLVDRPANKRAFLLVKRDVTMGLGAPITANPDGSFTAGATQKAPPPAAQPGDGAAPPASEAAPAMMDPAGKLSLTKDMKSAMVDMLASLADTVAAAQKAVDGADEAEDEATANPAPLAEMLASICESSEDAAMALLGIPDEAEGPPAGGVPEPGAPAAQAGPGMDAMPLSARDDGIPFGKRLAVRTAKRLINEVAATAKARTVVEKVGRRMAKSRLERFKSALRVFADLLSELDVSAKAAPPPPAKKPGAAPPAAACKTDAEKAELSREIAEKNAEIAALRKAVAPGGSNALSVESTPEPAREPRWSLDMGNDTRPKFGDVLDVPL